MLLYPASRISLGAGAVEGDSGGPARSILTRQLLHGPFGGPEKFHTSLAQALLAGLITPSCYVLALTAWGQRLLFARLVLPLRGQLPWATLTPE
ncbi:hypothetical protein [Kitasatospora mediocidica]|uniref:hypothetical protein n=1 Tax=Kitasatospora mediocidica TaxID=58352 RepID=UPI0012F81774|nr:hypothetical protein [Kitasatospora mediocidica]